MAPPNSPDGAHGVGAGNLVLDAIADRATCRSCCGRWRRASQADRRPQFLLLSFANRRQRAADFQLGVDRWTSAISARALAFRAECSAISGTCAAACAAANLASHLRASRPSKYDLALSRIPFAASHLQRGERFFLLRAHRTAIAVFGAIELARLGKRWLTLMAVGIILFEIAPVLILRAHYTMDVFTGLLAAICVAQLCTKVSPSLDARLSPAE